MRMLAPVSLTALCWGLSALIAGLALANPQRFDLLELFMQREGLSRDAFTLTGTLWLITAFLAFAIGTVFATITLRPPRPAPAPGSQTATRVFMLNLFFLGVTLLWVLATLNKAGGLVPMMLLVGSDSLAARDLLLETKLFPGMRLCYAALPATGCLAAALLCQPQEHRARRLCQLVLVINTLALVLLPLVMSQRLLLMQFLLSAYLVVCLQKRRLWAPGWLAFGGALFLAVWIGREALTNPTLSHSALQIGMQKMAFYVVNDLWNAYAPLTRPFQHMLGTVSLRGLMFFTFTDGLFDASFHAQLMTLETLRGGGEFPLFSAPYVDFGILGGALALIVIGFTCQAVFIARGRSLWWRAAYAQIGAGLLFSSHGFYLMHQNQLSCLLVIALVARWSRPQAKVFSHATA